MITATPARRFTKAVTISLVRAESLGQCWEMTISPPLRSFLPSLPFQLPPYKAFKHLNSFPFSYGDYFPTGGVISCLTGSRSVTLVRVSVARLGPALPFLKRQPRTAPLLPSLLSCWNKAPLSESGRRLPTGRSLSLSPPHLLPLLTLHQPPTPRWRHPWRCWGGTAARQPY